MIAAWRPSAPSAPLRIAAATDTAVFRAYTQHGLVPQLQPEPIAESDNLSRHQGTVIRQLIEAAGCRLWLRPPYSSDRNPIKKMWSKIKAFLRAAKVRCMEELDCAVAAGLEKVTPQGARGWLGSHGYRYIKS